MRLSFRSLAQWRSGALAALTRFPWNMLCGATGAACAIISIHSERNEWLDGQCVRLTMAAALGMPLFFSLRILRERAQEFSRWPIEILGVPLLALWVYAQPPQPFNGPGIVWVRWLLLLATLHFFTAVSAYIRGKESLGFWQFNRRLFLRFCLAALYTGVLTIGFELALLSADKLFDLKLSKAYGDLFFIMTGLFHPALFLAGVPRDFAALNTDTEYPRGLKAFTQFALAPLVAVYTLILYAYAAKIIGTWRWPHGWVALPVLLLSGIGILAALLLYPLQNREQEKWAVWFTRNFPRALAPLTILLLLSLHVRIAEYGVTEERYLGVVLGVWIFVWALVFIVRRDAGVRWIPASLTVICLLAAFGPWGAGAISKTSQLRRVQRILQAKGLWRDSHAQAADRVIELPIEEAKSLRSTLSYLVGIHGGKAIEKIFAPILSKKDWTGVDRWKGVSEVMAALKISERDFAMVSSSRNSRAPINVEGFRRLWQAEQFGGEQRWIPQRCDDVSIGLDFGVLKLATNQDHVPQAIPLDNLLNDLSSSSSGELPDKNLSLDFQHGTRSFRIVFRSIHLRNTPEGPRVTGYQLYLLER